MREKVLLMGEREALVGIVTLPDATERDPELPALLLLNSGMLHRIGPGRLYAKLARKLAQKGFLVLRFDLSGIGDSSARRDDPRPPEARWPSEVQEAMDTLQEKYGVSQFGLTGICLGAKVAYLTALEDPRVSGAALINPQDHLHDSSNEAFDSEIMDRAIARHNWRLAFATSMSGLKWRKVLSGRVDLRNAARRLGARLKNLFARSVGEGERLEIESAFVRLRDRGAKIRHLYSEADLGLDYLHVMLAGRLKAYRAEKLLDIEIIQGSNHSFTLLAKQEELAASLENWARSLAQD
jgi:pimeloyl-ACP methyl ester carboxylesterase